ncbi:conserved hypothetical protein [Neospora caninum Liverpool]|uniref:Uncharacterized protein n=1 Tax=Neospora caninum (strain Liverpool) TaxID=572307 RepID=F0VNK3_NEOCL|nr:conserved hypothetical protein [Neospora caninum Liverpool]CBZ55299.1 conserved hypothetical protein [Neospora caninum Liverpool]CEL70031.1 TPA: hypothetical protein BN1204_057220 [Neospora caninum Liverpool]|eukprot:XP_003885327.1 conserved hypothetical protein [Neospora caninum Liverpool]
MMFHRRPNAGGALDGAVDAASEGGDQRAQCVRFCATMFLVLSTLFIIRVQQERYEHSSKNAYRVVYKYPWEHGSFLKDEHSQLQLVYLHPAFSVLPTFVESLDDVSLLTQPLGMRRPASAASPRFFHSAAPPNAFQGNVSVSSRLPSENLAFPAETVASEWLSRQDLGSNWLLFFRASAPESAGPDPTDAAKPRPEATPSVSPASGLQAPGTGSPGGDGDAASRAWAGSLSTGAGSIVGVVMDSRLFRRVRLPGCSSTSAAMFADHCFIAVVRFPLHFCFDSASVLGSHGDASGGLPAAQPSFLDISWTCMAPPAATAGAAVGAAPRGDAGEDSTSLHCIHVVSGLSVGSIQRYMDRVTANVQHYASLRASPLSPSSSSSLASHFGLGDRDEAGGSRKAREGTERRDEAGTRRPRALRDVGTVAYFCGNPVRQLLALDTAGSRLFFAQPVPRRPSATGEGEDVPGPTRRMSSADGRGAAGGEGSGFRGGEPEDVAPRPGGGERAGDESLPVEPSLSLHPEPGELSRRQAERRAAAEDAASPVGTERGGGDPAAPARFAQPVAPLENAFSSLWGMQGRDASLCIAAVSLEESYREVTECREVRNQVAIDLGDGAPAEAAWRGVWLHYDARNSSVVLFSFDHWRAQDLVLTSMHADTMQLKFSLRFRDFQSGWFLSSEDSSSGKILLIGDRPPYMGTLQSIDVETGFREHADLHRASAFATREK